MNRALTWVGILMLGAVSASGAPNPRLLPVQDGNYWILESSLGDQKIIRCDPGKKKLLQVTGMSERGVVFYASRSSIRLYGWDPARGRLRPTVRLRPFAKERSKFSVGKHPCDQLLVKLAPVAWSIRTKSGEYTGCSVLWIVSRYKLLPGLCNTFAERIYFAPGVGPVAVQGSLGQLYLLTEARVGGVLVGGQ